MDEKNQSSILTALLRILKPINAILVGITLLTSIFILLDSLLPHFGLMLNFSNYGHSMEPTIKGNALLIISLPSRTPFESLEVGDVIMFKEPKGLNTATDIIKVHISKVDKNGSPSSDSASPSETSESESIYSLENIEYLPDRAVLHRIVEITTADGIDGAEGSSTLLITQGDHNPIPDRYPITEDAYLGRMLWEIDYVGDVILFLYNHFDLIITMTVITSLTTAVVTILQWSYTVFIA